MIRAAVLAAAVLALPAAAQDEVAQGGAAILRGLDKVNGQTTDLVIARGGFADFGRLEIEMRECRYPAGNPAGDAFAFVVIRVAGQDAPLFEGWMIASAPALNALDHPRYDVWVIRCQT